VPFVDCLETIRDGVFGMVKKVRRCAEAGAMVLEIVGGSADPETIKAGLRGEGHARAPTPEGSHSNPRPWCLAGGGSLS